MPLALDKNHKLLGVNCYLFAPFPGIRPDYREQLLRLVRLRWLTYHVQWADLGRPGRGLQAHCARCFLGIAIEERVDPYWKRSGEDDFGDRAAGKMGMEYKDSAPPRCFFSDFPCTGLRCTQIVGLAVGVNTDT
jgi:hypothetical protein